MKNCLTPNDTSLKPIVESTIDRSGSLITALESVAAMYCVPSTNVLCDNTANTIRVDGETIIAPDIANPGRCKKAIMRSIGGVLDNISNRIDGKLDDFQYTNAAHPIDTAQSDESPSKGNVVGRHFDRNGDPITVYDTGVVDSANTPEAALKINELRQSLQIPMYKRPSYFTDQDDITAGLNDSAVPTESDLNDNTTNVPETIGESATMIDLYDELGGSRHMGADLLRSQGFDDVQPTSTFVQESNAPQKEIAATDLKYLRFDNTNILKAIKLLNEARVEQSAGNIDNVSFKKILASKKYQEAIDCLNKQFDARLNIRFFSDDFGMNAYTMIFNDFRNKITISKAKGFQLGKNTIEIHVVGHMISALMKCDSKLFGQTFISVLLHEIFHNIFHIMYSTELANITSLQITMNIATGIEDAKEQRVFLTNYVNSLDKFGKLKLNRITRKALVKRLALAASIKNDTTLKQLQHKLATDTVDNTSDKDLEKLTKAYEIWLHKHDPKRTKKHGKITMAIGAAVVAVSAVMRCCGGFTVHKLTLPACALPACALGGGVFIVGAGLHMSSGISENLSEQYADMTEKEEYYCDLFAAMYKLPVSFFLGFGEIDRKITANEVMPETLKEFVKVSNEINKACWSNYPSIPERNHASVTAAQKLMDADKDMDPALKEYLQWIVDNYASLHDTDIKEIYNQTTFDPKEAEDLDEHLQNLLKTAKNTTVTESATLHRFG